MNIEWKPCFHGSYEVSSNGDIRRHETKKLMGQHLRKDGRLTVHLSHGGKSIRIMVHRLVAEAFIGPRPDGLTINHKDGNKTNNCASNLEYITIGENVRHAHAMGLAAIGSRAGSARLTEEKVRQARERASQGESIATIAREFYVSASTLSHAVVGRSWKHAGGTPVRFATRTDTHCRRGHPIFPGSMYTKPNGGLECRECRRELESQPLPPPPLGENE